MTRSIKFFVFIIIIFFLFVSSASAESKKIIFDLATLTNNQTAGLWQIFNNTDKGLYPQGDNLLLRSDGDAYLVYDGQFSYHDYHRLRLVIASNQPLRLTVIPNVSTTGYNTYELRRELPASTELTEVTVSLRLPFFKKPVDDLGINFYSAKPAEILIKEISLEKLNSAELAAVAFKDYFRVFEYSPFTVNLFAAPRIFGRSALIYVLPIIIWLIWLSLKSKRWREVALILLLSCWLVIDLRMVYEFFNYQLADYRDYVKPPIAEKRLRTYQDFYQFADWVKVHLSPGQEVNFYESGNNHFPRLLQYLVYPLIINDETATAKTFLVYNRKDIFYNQNDELLYSGDTRLSEAGQIVDRYNEYSFIFQEQ